MRSIFCQSVEHQIRKLVLLFVSLSQTTFSSSFFQMQCGNVTTPENKALGPTPFPFCFKFWGLTKPELVPLEGSSEKGRRIWGLEV